MNCNELLGFEIGDLKTGKVLHQVVVNGFQKGPVKRHGCPSHGIGMTPDEKEIWVVDAFNQRLHIFDATVMPPKQVETIKVRDEPGWITFSIDGRLAYPATGDVIDVKTRQIITGLKDETGRDGAEREAARDRFPGKPARSARQPVRHRAGDRFRLGTLRACPVGCPRAKDSLRVPPIRL